MSFLKSSLQIRVVVEIARAARKAALSGPWTSTDCIHLFSPQHWLNLSAKAHGSDFEPGGVAICQNISEPGELGFAARPSCQDLAEQTNDEVLATDFLERLCVG